MTQAPTEQEMTAAQAAVALEALAAQQQAAQAQINALAVAAVLALWVQINPLAPLVSWLAGSPSLHTRAFVLLSMAQEAVAAGVRQYVIDAGLLAGDRVEVPPLVPISFAGVSADGTDLEVALLEPIVRAQGAINRKLDRARALRDGRNQLARIVATEVSDAAREATQVAITASKPVVSRRTPGRRRGPPSGSAGMGYIRVITPGACARCILLAGKWYAWNAGFLRHPACLCTHISVTRDNAENLSLVNDPNRVFDAMTPQEQDQTFTKAGAQAIRDGADVAQVIAARKGMSYAGITRVRVTDQGNTVNVTRRVLRDDRTTKSGITRRGFYGGYTEAGRAKLARLTPQEIYRRAQGDRAFAVELLTRYGYIIG